MKSFRIKNIKSFVDSGEIEIAPLTIFVGQNSCGKSTLLRFPVVLAQSALNSSSPIVLAGRYVDYGFFNNVVHNQKGNSIYYEYSYDVDFNMIEDARYILPQLEYEKKDHIEDIKRIKMGFDITERNKTIDIQSISMYIEGTLAVRFRVDNDEKKYADLFMLYDENNVQKTNYSFELRSLEFRDGGFPFYEPGDLFASIYTYIMKIKENEYNPRIISDLYDKLFVEGNPYRSEKMSKKELKMYSIKKAFDKMSDIMSHVYVSFRDEAYMMNYIGPFREAPSRIYRDSEINSMTMGVGVHGENVSSLLIRDYRRKKKIISEISKWLEPTMGYKIDVDNVGDGFFQIALVNKQGVHSDISDVGYGISQVLPIVTQIIRNNLSNSVMKRKILNRKPVYIEQPELHLHPAAQSMLADLFVNCVCKGASNIVIETHSEHLLRKLQVLISDKNNNFTSDMVKIYYIDKNNRGNGTVKEMKIAENGKFETAWPSGFFDKAHLLTMELLNNTIEEL